MAKASKQDPGTAVQTVENKNIVPAELMDVTEQDAGLGVSFKQEDQLLPLIYVLQTNSPAVDKRGDAHIEGAEAGHFWLRNSIDPIKDGEEGIEAIPCCMHRSWIEWLPNRGGFVARHDSQPNDVETRTVRDDSGREKAILVRSSNGNIIQDTREFFLLIGDQPYVLPCAGTKHTFARQWQTMFHQFRHPKTNDVMPAFARKYRLTTVPASNAAGKWFGLKFEDLGFVTIAEYNAAKTFFRAVEAGEKRAEAPLAGAAAQGDDEVPF